MSYVDKLLKSALNTQRAPVYDPRRPPVDQRTAWTAQSTRPGRRHFEHAPARMGRAVRVTIPKVDRGHYWHTAALAICHQPGRPS